MTNRENITPGVKCVVNTCEYYKQGNLCTAGKIEITPRNAAQSNETDCATFSPQESIH